MTQVHTNKAFARRTFLKVAGAAATCTPLSTAWGSTPDLHEALHYERLKNKLVRCNLCPRHCTVGNMGRGLCGVRENRDGTYYSLVYGRPVTIHNDPIEKKPLFHVYPGQKALSIATVGCNIHCRFCQNWEISQKNPDDVSPPFLTPSDIAAQADRAGSKVVAYTYNEPTIFYEYMLDCARAAEERGIGSVIISNGFIEAAPQRELMPHLTAYKVDLKAFTQTFYAQQCAGELQPVLESLKRLAASDTWFEIVVLLIPTLNDNDDEIKRMTDWVVRQLGPDVPIHFTRFHPEYKMRNLPPTPTRTVIRAREIAMNAGCHFVYTGNMPGGAGEHTYCPDCKRAVIKRYGFYILANNMDDGRCPDCGRKIPGVW
jgi:pyruvate formate lyase activating enzyme